MEFKIINADCVSAMRDLIDKGVMVDSIVTDPPYELGFMGKKWDASGIAYNTEMWQLCMQLLKPGGHLLSFGGSRTYHRMAVAIEDAGFEIRDCIMWIYGQGFPKSLNISKAIDKLQGAEREPGVPGKYASRRPREHVDVVNTYHAGIANASTALITTPATDAAKKWEGWGTALKPAYESIIVGRKPLSEKTVAENVLKHGTGGLNIDGCRIAMQEGDSNSSLRPCRIRQDERIDPPKNNIYGVYKNDSYKNDIHGSQIGRFPANLIHDGSEEVLYEFAKYGESVSKASANRNGNTNEDDLFRIKRKDNSLVQGHSDKGTAARFYYEAPFTDDELAHNQIVLARKPLSEDTVAENVLKHGTGGLNIDGCRIGIDPNDENMRPNAFNHTRQESTSMFSGLNSDDYKDSLPDLGFHNSKGRFPANLIHDGSEEVVNAFPITGGGGKPKQRERAESTVTYSGKERPEYNPYQDTLNGGGSASRFYYSAKANKKDRMGSKHPTVKPISLMRYLCRLVTPKGGTVLDPFAGSGSTGQAAIEEGFNVIMIEREAEYIPDIERRMEKVKGVMVQTDLMEDGERNSTDA
jgi:DNA modification methylase